MIKWGIEQIHKEKVKEVVQIIHEAYNKKDKEFSITKENFPGYAAFQDEHILAHDLEQGKDFFVLYENRIPVGTVRIVDAPARFGKGYIGRLAVLPEEQKKGYGSKLMDYAEKLLFNKGVRCVEVSVMKEDIKLQDYFLKRGYQMTHEITGMRLGKGLKCLELDRKKYLLRAGIQ